MSMVHAIAWDMVDLRNVSVKERVEIKRRLRSELSSHGMKLHYCWASDNAAAVIYSLTWPGEKWREIEFGNLLTCCRTALKVIEGEAA